jgi:carbamoyl-phosphate synthase large subunit
MKTVLVTGVGAVIGYGILRELRETRPDVRLIACDTNPDAVGQHWCDSFHLAPPVLTDDYASFITSLIGSQSVNLVIPGFEQDVAWLNEHRGLFTGRSILALNAEKLIRLTRDKWTFSEDLRRSCSALRIPTYLDCNFESLVQAVGMPFIAKPRVSYASKGLRLIRSREDYVSIDEETRKQYIFQPVVGSQELETTVSVFSDGQGSVLAQISLRRLLSPEGSSWKVWTFDDDSLNEAVKALISHYRPVGNTNLQFRRGHENWLLLEINPRISSSISFRRGFGYYEATMAVDYFLEGISPTQPTIRQGVGTRHLSEAFKFVN